MKIVKVNVKLSIGYSNASREDELDIEVPEGLSKEEEGTIIWEEVEQWSQNYIDIGFSRA
jgi:hypothetical protein